MNYTCPIPTDCFQMPNGDALVFAFVILGVGFLIGVYTTQTLGSMKEVKNE